jgi:hypothetical protein
MAARKIKTDEPQFKFTILDGEKYIRINDILTTCDYHRKTIERFCREGRLETRKWNGKRLVKYASYLAFMD